MREARPAGPRTCRLPVCYFTHVIAACARHGLRVGLSTWFREDRDKTRMTITSPEDLGRVWVAALNTIPSSARSELLHVDLCNEWPLDVWAPFCPKGTLC